MSAFRFDTRLAAAALLALGLGAAAPDWAAAQGGGGQCQLWAKMETAVKAADLKAAIALEEEIDLEPRCSGKGLDAKKAVVEVYRALDAKLERQKATPKVRLAQLKESLKFYNAYDILAKIADLQTKVPGKRDVVEIATVLDRAVSALDELPESELPPKDVVGRLTGLAYQYEALAVQAGTPIQRSSTFGRSARQVNVGFVPAPLQFEYNKAELTLAGKGQAQTLLAELQAKNYPSLHLVGHTDPVGTFEYNDELSEDRAEAIKKFLEDNGYPKGRITVEGRGKRDVSKLKIVDAHTFTEAEIHQMLRRVELKFKE